MQLAAETARDMAAVVEPQHSEIFCEHSFLQPTDQFGWFRRALASVDMCRALITVLDGEALFFSQTGMMGGPAPVRRFLPHLMDLVLARKINPGKVFDLTLPLADVAEGYRAMDERRAIKTLLRL